MIDQPDLSNRALKPIELAERRSAARLDRPAGSSVLSYEMVQNSIDREDERIRAQRASHTHRRSTSDFVPRCDTCGQWPIRDELNMCRGDGGWGHPYIAQQPLGLPIVR